MSDNHYHERVTYDSKKENWGALTGIFMIPLFLLFFGFGFFKFFNIPQNISTSDTPDNENGLIIGIGGGPEFKVTISPTPSPTAPFNVPVPTFTQEGLHYIQ